MKAKCSCKHEGQDALHGQGVRVHNPKAKADTYTCSVCGVQRTINKKA